MKQLFFLMGLLLIARVAPPRNYLSSALEASGLHLTLEQVQTWREARKQKVLTAIKALPDSVKASLTARADRYIDFTWPALPVSLYHEFKTTGNRTHYETRLTERRTALASLVIGELVSGDPKYMPAIADGLWATLEESTWVLPAHVGMQHIGTDLPDPDENVVDLIDGETASSVGAIQWLLSSELDRFSPVLGKRVRYELTRRVIAPYLGRNDFWWMGFNNRVPNNWNPWINGNVLVAELLTGVHADTINLVLDKVLRSTDNFVNGYGDDGGCDEGPTYWSEAGGKLIHILELASSVSGGRLDWSGIPLLHRIGSYISTMHIAGPYVVNFADATPRTLPDPVSVYGFGQYFHDDTLRHFAAYLFDLRHRALPTGNVHDFVLGVETYGALASTPAEVAAPALRWLPSVQVMVARAPDLVFAAQGGNNGESHNHNDVGNFILYAGDAPVIVDAGVGTYTAKTFSSQRYTLWNMQSQWHNCPVINGVQQKDGAQYKATDVRLDGSVLRMNLASAYPAEAAVKRWDRTFDFNPRDKTLRLEDDFVLDVRKDSTCLNFLTPCTVTQSGPGRLTFSSPSGTPLLVLSFSAAALSWQTTVKDMDDARLQDSWGKSLTRVSLVLKDPGLSGKTEVRFSMP
ncbi:heparinase II/III domain-containing protein [Dinghuibacter silviterrae]|uniref:Heparinase II/III-like protein n=1 Tax=Dinghuibacter silviterrae TaxID=1539049 RepID=A0A4R8DGQ2_9BACT|nr:heparinase II/III family protein [Dinghuibacter silviterrae]TDW96859.1 heparinase II/III-like protein [Dinghuibacter silviterrae]